MLQSPCTIWDLDGSCLEDLEVELLTLLEPLSKVSHAKRFPTARSPFAKPL